MPFIDEALIEVIAGDGGNGCVAFRREKYVARGGPSGGDGGHGGSVYLVGDSGLDTLFHLRYKQRMKAERGRHGEGSDRTGRTGNDLEIKVPLGTVARVHEAPGAAKSQMEADEDLAGEDGWADDSAWDGVTIESSSSDFDRSDADVDSGDSSSPAERRPRGPRQVEEKRPGDWLGEVLEPGERLLVARGGRGGRGNARFATATRRAPRQAEEGRSGETHWVKLELKLLADVGLVGLPNAGKSTLISVLSAARPKVADYPFTTLVPQLGVVAGESIEDPFVIADLPGLIAGAAQGAGLGHQFLRHVDRCRVLVHLVDLSGGLIGLTEGAGDELPSAEEELRQIERELEAFDPGLLSRPRILVGSKSDSALDGRRNALRAAASRRSLSYHEISAATHTGLMPLKRDIRRLLAATDAADETDAAPGS